MQNTNPVCNGRWKRKAAESNLLFGQSEYADLDTILDELDNVKFDYLTFGSALQEDQKAKVTKWIKEKENQERK